jgi:hypothetical protein
MADAALKPERDYSKEADKQIPEAEELAKVWALFALGFFPLINIPIDRHPCCH